MQKYTSITQQHPIERFSVGTTEMSLALPDATEGYYRATRFDWSGIITELSFEGHKIFGEWLPEHDPEGHDHLAGPVDSFNIPEFGPGTYTEAKPGDRFLRIGVGWLERVNEDAFHDFNLYPIVDGGIWTTKNLSHGVRFRQVLPEHSGLAYEYEKEVTLNEDGSSLTLTHRLKNTGSLPIQTETFNHNFFTLEGSKVGAKWELDYQAPTAEFGAIANHVEGRAVIKNGRLQVLPEELDHPFFTELGGYPKSEGYRFAIRHKQNGLRVDVSADRPVSKFITWACPTTLCPEPYIALDIAPGDLFDWTIRYDFSVEA